MLNVQIPINYKLNRICLHSHWSWCHLADDGSWGGKATKAPGSRWHWLQAPQILRRPGVWNWPAHAQPSPERENNMNTKNIPPGPYESMLYSLPVAVEFSIHLPDPPRHHPAPPTSCSPLIYKWPDSHSHCQFVLGSIQDFQAVLSDWFLGFCLVHLGPHLLVPSAKGSLFCYM